jgi:hypothetical protein
MFWGKREGAAPTRLWHRSMQRNHDGQGRWRWRSPTDKGHNTWGEKNLARKIPYASAVMTVLRQVAVVFTD